MSNKISNNIEALESKLEELLKLSHRLAAENNALKQQMQELRVDRSGLLTQKEQVRIQVEAMITRLKAMESA
jgi:uncharacterized protein (TIGR02449 family)